MFYNAWKFLIKLYSVSRSIGDSIATKLEVISTPIILEKFLGKETEFICIASKGILEVLSNKNILDQINGQRTATNWSHYRYWC